MWLTTPRSTRGGILRTPSTAILPTGYPLPAIRSTHIGAQRMDYRDRITIEPGKRGGKPCIRGMRITGYDVLDYLASGMTQEQLLAELRVPSPRA